MRPTSFTQTYLCFQPCRLLLHLREGLEEGNKAATPHTPPIHLDRWIAAQMGNNAPSFLTKNPSRNDTHEAFMRRGRYARFWLVLYAVHPTSIPLEYGSPRTM